MSILKYRWLPIIAACSLTMSTNTYCDDYVTTGSDTNTTANTSSEAAAQYIFNWGSYQGLNLNYPSSSTLPGTAQISTLFNAGNESALEWYVVSTMLGAFPVNSALSTIISTSGLPSTVSSVSSYVNNFANLLYGSSASTPYTPSVAYAGGSSASNSGNVTAVTYVDQQTALGDPVSQSILNLVATPDPSYCSTTSPPSTIGAGALNAPVLCQATSASGTASTQLCTNHVSQSIVGTPPADGIAFNSSTNATLTTQLNSNTLLTPLLYSTSSGANVPASGAALYGSALPFNSQAQQAENYIRFAINGAAPTPLPTFATYQQYWNTWSTNNDPTLQNYLGNLWGYVARMSVPISNLYYLFSKRMPQPTAPNTPTSTTSAAGLSQALSEFQMATWRIYNPDPCANSTDGNCSTSSGGQGQWATTIDNASPATVAKETALLLSEINYQLYLNRQLQERQLLTESLILIQSLVTNPPPADMNPTTTTCNTNGYGGNTSATQ